MKIAHIKISNILGIDELELSPKGYTQISGTNGTGKTSVLEAIKAALKSGHDATLLRDGADKAEAVIVLDDGTQITKTITASSSATNVRGPDGKKMARPAEVINRLADMLSVNPVDFLSAPKKERVRVLLEAMPLDVDIEKLSELAGISIKEQPGMHALAVIDAAYNAVYDGRTGTNRAVKEKEATINQLKQAMPDAVGGVEGDETALQKQLDAAIAARDSKRNAINKKMQDIEEENRLKIDAIRVKLQKDIDELKSLAQTAVDEINSVINSRRNDANLASEMAKDAYTTKAQPISAALQAIRSNRDAAAKRQGTLETIATMEDELEHLVEEAAHQTQALASIEAYKSELLSSLPIPGLTVKDGEVYRDGIVLDRLNTAQQVQIAVDLAKLRSGELGVVCVDRIESLDKESREALKKGALEAGLQLFVTRVSDGEFAINTAG